LGGGGIKVVAEKENEDLSTHFINERTRHQSLQTSFFNLFLHTFTTTHKHSTHFSKNCPAVTIPNKNPLHAAVRSNATVLVVHLTFVVGREGCIAVVSCVCVERERELTVDACSD
jgi:hypothetical protein